MLVGWSPAMRICRPNLVISTFRRRLNDLRHEAKIDDWEAVIGLEVHAQISANSKLFSGAETVFGAPINSAVSFFDASLPGTLPVLNRACVIAAIRTASSLNCTINSISHFDRKHYFYADLPAGYQITQKRFPLASGGYLSYLVNYKGKNIIEKTAHLTQIQLEQDSGKSIHDVYDKKSLIDLNRAGIGLMEIITEPDFRSAEEVISFAKELQLLLQTIGSCDAKMEEGSLRIDASISIRRPNGPLGVRTEVKNINSIRSLGRAVESEIERQKKDLENGIPVESQTLFYDNSTDCTVPLRDKEKVHDYRFMPEPNLPTLHVSDDLNAIARDLPMLPRIKRLKLVHDDQLSMEQSVVLVSIPELLDLYEVCSAHFSNKALNSSIANFCTNEVLATANKLNVYLCKSNLDPNETIEILSMVFIEKTINLSIAKQVLERIMNPSQKAISARHVVEEGQMKQLSDDVALRALCQQVINEHADAVKSFRTGKKKAFNFLVGQVQKLCNGKANGSEVADILNELISQK